MSRGLIETLYPGGFSATNVSSGTPLRVIKRESATFWPSFGSSVLEGFLT